MRTSRVLAMGSVATAVGAMAFMNRSKERAIQTFYERAAPETTVHEVDGTRLRLPLVFHRAEGFWALFPAGLDRVRAILCSPELHPVRTLDGRATVGIGAFRYHEGTFQLADGGTGIIEPYAEVFMGPLVTRRPAPPMIEVAPAIATRFGVGIDVIHLPVTTRQARDGGIVLWGLPKFVADMEFDDSLVERSVRLSEDGEDILTLGVMSGGRETLEHDPKVMYGVRDGELLEAAANGITRARQRFGPKGVRLELGRHAVAESIRALEIEDRAIASVTELDTRFSMGGGQPIGRGIAHPPFGAPDRDHGRYVVRHPGTDWIEQYPSRPARVRHEPAVQDESLRAPERAPEPALIV